MMTLIFCFVVVVVVVVVEVIVVQRNIHKLPRISSFLTNFYSSIVPHIIRIIKSIVPFVMPFSKTHPVRFWVEHNVGMR